jgi:hypothetical protein
MATLVLTNPNTSIYQMTTMLYELANSHPNVKSVFFGDIYEFDMAKQSLFPYVQYYITNSTINEKTITHNIKMIFADRKVIIDNSTTGEQQNYSPGFNREDNLIDIWNTGFGVGTDIVSYIRKRKELYDVNTVTGTPFDRRMDNGLCGYEFNFTLTQFNNTNACIVSE